MKKIIVSLALFLPFITINAVAADPVGLITYCLPSTVISVKVQAAKEVFKAGPYCKYAKKYLGIDARQQDETNIDITSINMYSFSEADQSQRYFISKNNSNTYPFLQLTSLGLISNENNQFTVDRESIMPYQAKSELNDNGLISNLTTENGILLKKGGQNGKDTTFIQPNIIVEKSLEEKAKEAADLIHYLRQKRLQIATGDSDATFSGEALGAALAEISKLEKDYLQLFTGISTVSYQSKVYDIIPSKSNKNQSYIAFRVSKQQGLVSSENVSGKPYLLTIDYKEIKNVNQDNNVNYKGGVIYYKIPVISNVKISDGISPLLQARMPIYQLGVTSTFPVDGK